MPNNDTPRWFQDHRNMIRLTHWMADNGYEAGDIADAVEKPWKYTEEFTLAGGVLDPITEARLVPAPEWTI